MQLWSMCFLALLGVSVLLWMVGVARRVAEPWTSSYYLAFYTSVPTEPSPFPAITICPQIKISNASGFPVINTSEKTTLGVKRVGKCSGVLPFQCSHLPVFCEQQESKDMRLRALARRCVRFNSVAQSFGVRLGKTASEIFQMPKEVFKEDLISKSPSGRWYMAFKEGREEIADERPKRAPNNDQNRLFPKEELMTDLSGMCDHISLPADFQFTSPEVIIKHVKNVAPKLDDVFESCFWRKAEVNCSNFFYETLTDEGLCFTFNMVAASSLYEKKVLYWLGEEGGKNKSGWGRQWGYGMDVEDRPDEFYPLPAYPTGVSNGLEVTLASEAQETDCLWPFRGFKVQFHNPEEIPFMDAGYLRIPDNALVGVNPEQIHVMQATHITDMSPEEKGCHNYENHLEYFAKYSERNCEMECITNLALTTCGCVAFYMPRMNNSIQICKNKQCLNDVLHKARREGLEKCKCKQACSHVLYNLEPNIHELSPPKNQNSSTVKSRMIVYVTGRQQIDFARKEHVTFSENVAELPEEGVTALTGLCFLVLTLLTWHASVRLKFQQDINQRELQSLSNEVF